MTRNFRWLNALCATASLLIVCLSASAEAPLETVSTKVQLAPASLGKGANLRPSVEALVQLIRDKRLYEAERSAKELRLRFEEGFNAKQRQYVFSSTSERDEFMATSKDQFEWVDWGYAECLKILAYLESEKRNFGAAAEILKAAMKVAPTSASLEVELGYAFNFQRKNIEALDAYRSALDKALRFPTQKPYEPIARRGIGVTLIELNQLDEAKLSLEESLKTDPNSPVAKNELEYIRHLQLKPHD